MWRLRRPVTTVFNRPQLHDHNVSFVSICGTITARCSGSSSNSNCSSTLTDRLLRGCRHRAIVTTTTTTTVMRSLMNRNTAQHQQYRLLLLSVIRSEWNDHDRFKPPAPNIRRRRRYIPTLTTPPTIRNHMNTENKTATNINETTTATNTEGDVETSGCVTGNTSSSNDSLRQNHDHSKPPPPPYTIVVQHWLQQLRAIPNLITLSRILLIPFLSYWIIQHHTLWALIGCVYAAGSDVMDGYLARKYPATMQTPLGTYLDPLGTNCTDYTLYTFGLVSDSILARCGKWNNDHLTTFLDILFRSTNLADKLFINVISISLWVNGTLPTTLVGLWLIRDIVLMIATHHYVAQHTRAGMAVMDPVTVPIQVIPTTLSKINTALQFITLVVAIVATPPMVAVATDTAAAVTTMMTTSTVETLTTEMGSTTQYDRASHIHHDDMLLRQRQYITDHILSPLCWVTGATTIASSLSYYGHSAFIATANTSTAPNATSHTDDRHSAK